MSGHRTQGGAHTHASTGASKRAQPSRRAKRHDEDLKRFTDPIPDALVLAGVQRADLHWPHAENGAVMSRIAAHLGYQHSAWTTRNLRPQLERLASEGLLHGARVHSVLCWSITPAGRRRLAAARRRDPVELPESPQHREWRHAREQAAEHISEMRALFDDALSTAGRLLDQDAPESIELMVLADRLKQTSWQLGSALYCLNEWPEPDDAKADQETHVMGSVTMGRRATWNWKDRDELDEREQSHRARHGDS